MYFKRKVHSLVAFIMSALLCVTVLSACNQTEEVQSKDTTLTSSTTSATTATQETTTQTTTEKTTTVSETTEITVTSKLEPVSEDMPEIVFIASNRYYKENISGFYITNTGEIKMYDFREIAPNEIYEIPDVYDRLKEVTCSTIDYELKYISKTETITEKELGILTKDELIQYYNDLLLINGKIEYNEKDPLPEHTGHYKYYGVKNNDSGDKEFILLYGFGRDYEYFNSDQRADELLLKIVHQFPDVPLSLD